MTKLYDTVLSIGYEQGDFNSLPELINDIGEEVKEKLKEEIKITPIKCNIFIIYHSLVGGHNDLIVCEGMGQSGEQSRDNGKHHKKGLTKGNKRIAERNRKS